MRERLLMTELLYLASNSRYDTLMQDLAESEENTLAKANAGNLKAMIKLAKERKIQVILLAVPRPGLILSPLKQYQQVADDMQIVIENNILSNILQQPQYHSDMIHPNALGYQKIAQAIADLLDKHGAVNL